MRTEEAADGARLSAATRYESLVGVSNAIGTHRDPKDLFSALVRELHRVVRFDYIGVAIRDEKANTFHRHFVDAETEAAIPPDPELPIEESDAWWVYQNQEPLVTSLETHDARFSKLHEILKKYGVHCLCTLPLTTAHSKVGTLTFGSKAPDAYTADEVHFLSVVAEQIALAFDNALHFDASQASQQQLLKKNERLGLLLELTNHVVSNLGFQSRVPGRSPSGSGEHAPGYELRRRRHNSSRFRQHTLADLRLGFCLQRRIRPRGEPCPDG